MKGQETKMLVAFSISNTMPSVSLVVSSTLPARQRSTFAQIYFRCCCRQARVFNNARTPTESQDYQNRITQSSDECNLKKSRLERLQGGCLKG